MGSKTHQTSQGAKRCISSIGGSKTRGNTARRQHREEQREKNEAPGGVSTVRNARSSRRSYGRACEGYASSTLKCLGQRRVGGDGEKKTKSEE